jgi:steroid 5-alpha reductase family enzyme
MRYEDQPLCETCQARYPGAGIRHPPNHQRDGWRLVWWSAFLLLLAVWDVHERAPWWATAGIIAGVVLLLMFAGSILHHELVDRPRFRRERRYR